jgi:hypothetical protein
MRVFHLLQHQTTVQFTHIVFVCFLWIFTTNIEYFQKQHKHICLYKWQGFCFQRCGNRNFVKFRYISVITCIRVCVLGPSNLETFPSTFEPCLQHTTLFCYVTLAGHAHKSARHWTRMEFWHALKDHFSKNTSFSGRSDNSIIYSKSLLFVISSRY